MKTRQARIGDKGRGNSLLRQDLAKTAPVATGKASVAQEAAGKNAPPSTAYIVVDSKKCSGCTSCMLACSLVNEGEQNLSLARIQITQTSFGRFPDDISIQQCRQCVVASCVEACPVNALFIDPENGNIRRIDRAKCKEYQIKSNGCQKCNEACSHRPHMSLWNHEKQIATKCDLCVDARYWGEKGGPEGKQACVEICPMKAIKLVKETPPQMGNQGYDVNLRNQHWGYIGLTTT
ncbi:MAG: 4Fe-4S dicluster domain-containing protein [Dehalococcoidales bacterium]|nr:4Fe-4S dicluster domain-containing protein [Dehalococcoidales bacterium]